MVRYAALKGLYELEKTIGCGGFAKVKMGIHVATGEKVAIKIMEKTALGDDLPRVKIEVEAMKTLMHQHICKLYQVIETESHYFMVTEYCCGGELFDHIVEKNKLTESESRKFFRQIVSAVAYLHSLGFAHRDLKPENVLLDKDQNLKLIDFGLCAKPKGGMQNYLYTSCGSPTYAAPELILGQKYLGGEVDIWSMGVLLFTLLCGFLPFDDDNIENLYQKILKGNYEEPLWLSPKSKRLIREMLQIEPKKRISIKDLCNHPWITADFLNPVTITKKTSFEKDKDVLSAISAICNENKEDIWRQMLQSNRTDYRTATYLLLLDRKLRGLSLRISSNAKPAIRQENLGVKIELHKFLTNLDQSPRHKVHNETPISVLPNNEKNDCKKNNVNTTVSPRKRPRCSDDDSPILRKKPHVKNDQDTPSNCSGTPQSRVPQSSTPGSARKVIMGLERGINRVKDVLTPKKRPKDLLPEQPNVLSGKGLCNVSTTSSDSPKYVLSQLRRALQRKGIVCRQKGFVLQGETDGVGPESSKSNAKQSYCHSKKSCKFELEVCFVEGLSGDKPFVGIRRKRLEGNAWVYKRVCEEVLALAAEDISTDRENFTESKCLI